MFQKDLKVHCPNCKRKVRLLSVERLLAPYKAKQCPDCKSKYKAKLGDGAVVIYFIVFVIGIIIVAKYSFWFSLLFGVAIGILHNIFCKLELTEST